MFLRYLHPCYFQLRHRQHRLHRDIKSDNILVDFSGAVKIADFGYAAQLTKKQKKRNKSKTTRTAQRRLAMSRIPIAQFPDIVPPQVQVTGTYYGASAAVVEASVGQPIEAQVVGVDKMIYMKSNSANDGSYSLTVSFELGTNPDVDTVNVNNRVQQALARLPAEVQRYGVTVRKRSAAILEFLQFYSEGGKQDPLFAGGNAYFDTMWPRLDRIIKTSVQ